MLITAGNHVPVIPLGEVKPSVGATVPSQNGAMAAKSGVIGLVISTISVVGTPQLAPVGVKV